MKRAFLAVALTIIVVTASLVGVLITTYNAPVIMPSGTPNAYVGVTYCGDSVAQAKQLIDKVKGYTNLFCLQSGELQRDLKSVDEIGDYAVSKGMYFMPYFGNFVRASFLAWLEEAQQKWGSHLLGIYYSDEQAGKMLDGNVQFKDPATGDEITKTQYGDIAVQKANGIVIQYQLNGDIKLYQPSSSSDLNNEATFHPDGNVEVIRAQNGLADFSYKTYQQLNSIKPFKTLDETAQKVYDRDKTNIDTAKTNGKVFTSDYALYWFDYHAGYDVVLGQIGWNMSLTQQISLLRGAATTQGKDWGMIITWKYQQPPYLDNGTAIYEQMRVGYECGSKYFILFNYYDVDSGAYGTLKDEHFQALQNFWKNVLNNPKEVWDSTKADSVLIMPKNYGWGARWNTDHIWGIFPTDNQTQHAWELMQDAIAKHGLHLDIVYSDDAFPPSSTYVNIYKCD